MRNPLLIVLCLLIQRIDSRIRTPKYLPSATQAFGGVLNELLNLANTKTENTPDSSYLYQNKKDNRNAFKPYHVYVAIKNDDAKMAGNSKEQTTDKRVIDNSVDYWLGGGRFGKRYSDYGLAKTRFGRSLDHVDPENENNE